ncbi:hypothetical protein Tco_1459214 [Tanacetum coccineum]
MENQGQMMLELEKLGVHGVAMDCLDRLRLMQKSDAKKHVSLRRMLLEARVETHEGSLLRIAWMIIRIVQSVEDKLDYLEHPMPPAPVPAQAGQQVAPEALAPHVAWELKTLFAQQAEQELLQTVRCYMSQGKGKNKLDYVPKPKITPQSVINAVIQAIGRGIVLSI